MSREKRCRAKNWVFTLNNYTTEMENRLKELECEWMVFGHEEAPETGTKHLQGAICFKGRRDKNALNKLFPWFIEVMHGSPQDSKTYCTKEDMSGYFEKGIMPESRNKKGNEGNKKKWDDAYDAACEGKFDEIPRDLWVRYKHSFMEIYTDHLKDPNMCDVYDDTIKKHFLWLWGPTGTGKSHTARRIANELGCEEPYLKALNKWWNGYVYQKVTIIEEADPKKCEHLASFFKQWADKWAFTAECKGTVIQSCRPQYIIVTSNYPIEECFPMEADWQPLKRRFTEVMISQRDQHVYWPLNQAEWEEQQKEKEGDGLDVHAGNMNPHGRPASPGLEPESAQPIEEFEVEDLPSEPDEPKKKKRKCIED